MGSLNVLIADDHNLVRAGFRALVKRMDGVEVVAEARDGREAWDLILAVRPDLALIDISMPLLNGLELTARVAAEQPATRVVVLSMHSANDYIERAIRAGAAGYLLKSTDATELEQAIRAVDRGETYFAVPAGKRMPPPSLGRGARSNRLESLTPRQREVLQLIGEGYTTKEIARLIEVSVKTAEAHRTGLMKRLCLRDVTAVVRYAIAVGLVDPRS